MCKGTKMQIFSQRQLGEFIDYLFLSKLLSSTNSELLLDSSGSVLERFLFLLLILFFLKLHIIQDINEFQISPVIFHFDYHH